MTNTQYLESKNPKELIGHFIAVENFDGKNGKVKNQFLLRFSNGIVFQSYKSLIAVEQYSSHQVWLDKTYWDYSATTGKYRNQFLGETKKETEAKIKSGEYILCNLN